MKKLLFLSAFIGFVAIAVISRSAVPAALGGLTVTNNHTVATNVLSTNNTYLRATIIGLKAGGVSNSAAVFVGPNSNYTVYVIHPGERHIIDPRENSRLNFTDLWLRTPTTGDGLNIIFQ